MLLAEGFDDAIIGIGRRPGEPDLVAYSVEKCVKILVERDGVTKEEALQHLEYSTLNAWVGEETPIWVELMGVTEIRDLGGEESV